MAEALGTMFLLAVVVGSGVMGQRLADGNEALALLANSIPTGAGLFALMRSGAGQLLGEFVATFGLILAIISTARHKTKSSPWVVATYIVSAYSFTSSTSFANPAVTLARALTAAIAEHVDPSFEEILAAAERRDTALADDEDAFRLRISR